MDYIAHMAFSKSIPEGFSKSEWVNFIFSLLLEREDDPRHRLLVKLCRPDQLLDEGVSCGWGAYQIGFRMDRGLFDLCQQRAQAARAPCKTWMRNMLYRACIFSVEWYEDGAKTNM